MAAHFSTNSILHSDVANMSGDKLGRLEGFVINVEDATVQYAILSFGGMLSRGNKLFAVPMQAMELDTENDCFIVDVDADKLAHAQGFSPGQWPRTADPIFRVTEHGHQRVHIPGED